jgi:hypothetical protein
MMMFRSLLTPQCIGNTRVQQDVLMKKTGLIESKTVKQQLFLDHTVAEAAIGGITGGSILDQPWQHHMFQMFLLCMVTVSLEIKTSFAMVLTILQQEVHEQHAILAVCMDNLGVSEVDCSRNDMPMVKTTPPDSSGYAFDCGIADLPLDDCSRMTATAVMHLRIFANAFADEWTEPALESQAHSTIIDHVIKVCDLSVFSHGEVHCATTVVNVS